MWVLLILIVLWNFLNTGFYISSVKTMRKLSKMYIFWFNLMFWSYILSVMYCALKLVSFFILTVRYVVVTEYSRSIYPIYRYILHATYMFPWNSVTINHTQNASIFGLSVQTILETAAHLWEPEHHIFSKQMSVLVFFVKIMRI